MQQPIDSGTVRAGVPALIEALGDEDKSVRRNAISSLVQIGQPALPFLMKAMKAENPQLSFNAGVALGRIGDPAVVPELIEVLSDKHAGDTARSSAVEALSAIGEPTDEIVLVLTETLKDDTPWLRRHAARALKQIGTPEAIKAVEEFEKRN